MSKVSEVEKAFLSWLNYLHLQEEKLTNVAALKDGVVLSRLLNKADAESFPLGGITIQTGGAFEIGVKNLKTLGSRINKFFSQSLHRGGEKDTIDYEAIASTGSTIEIIKLCEKVLGVVSNCSKKDQYIDAILQLDEFTQTILMETMLKYIQEEEAPTSSPDLSKKIGSPGTDIINKAGPLDFPFDKDSKHLAHMVSTLKGENEKMSKELTIAKSKLEQYQSKLKGYGSPSVVIDSKKKLEEDFSNLLEQVEEMEGKRLEEEKSQKLIIDKLNDELFVANQKIKKLALSENLASHQKKKIETLSVANQKAFDDAQKQEAKILAYEHEKKLLEDKNAKLIEELYGYKNEFVQLEGKIKRIETEKKRTEEEGKRLEERHRFWEDKWKIAEEENSKLKEQISEKQFSLGAGSFLEIEKETRYKEEIAKLKAQLKTITESSGETLKAYVLSLEGKLENAISEKEKIKQEILLLQSHTTELEQHNDELKSQIVFYSQSSENVAEKAKEFQKIRQQSDLLLEAKKNSTKEGCDRDKMKKENDSLKLEIESMKRKLEETNFVNEKLEKCNIELEKGKLRDTERNSYLEDENAKLTATLKELTLKTNIEITKRTEEELLKERKAIKAKYKEKCQTAKKQAADTANSLLEKEEKIKHILLEGQENEKKMKKEYEEEIDALKAKYEEELGCTKKNTQEIIAAHKREDNLMSSAFYEMGIAITQIMEKEPDGLFNKSPHVLLSELAEVEEEQEALESPLISRPLNISSDNLPQP